jgi:hypothetical protein
MENTQRQINYWKLVAIILIVWIVFSQIFDVRIKLRAVPGLTFKSKQDSQQTNEPVEDFSDLEAAVLPKEGFTLPVKWGDLGKQMIETGVIDASAFEALYQGRGGLNETEKKLLYGDANGKLKITSQNSGVLLNLLWAFGLGNKNVILDNGPMQDANYGGAQAFASTGGWTLAKGDVMDHYSKHEFIRLSKKQQELVEKVSKNIYRPCCGNSTYFPDCNHGMAMLGLLELMAAQGVSEEDMYRAALRVNSYWFPQTYLTLAKFFNTRGVEWQEVDPQMVLGSLYSSSQGYSRVAAEVEPPKVQSGGGCGV